METTLLGLQTDDCKLQTHTTLAESHSTPSDATIPESGTRLTTPSDGRATDATIVGSSDTACGTNADFDENVRVIQECSSTTLERSTNASPLSAHDSQGQRNNG